MPIQVNKGGGWKYNISIEPFYTRLLGTKSEEKNHIGDHIRELIKNKSLHLCTDGSFCPKTTKVAHGWVVANDEGPLWSGASLIDCYHKYNMSPYRVAIGGLTAGLYILKEFNTGLTKPHCTVMIWCNCEKAIEIVKGKSYWRYKIICSRMQSL